MRRGRRGEAPTVLVAHPSADLYGSDRMLVESVDALVSAGWRVVVTVPADGPLVGWLRDRGVEVALCPAPVLRKSVLRPAGLVHLAVDVLRGATAGLGLVRLTRPDAVYVNTVTIPLWLVLARLCRRPVLAHVHEAEGSAPAVLRTVLAAPCLLATRVIVNSRYSRDVLLSSCPGLRGRTAVVYNAVPGPPRVVPARAELTEPVRLLFVGRLSPRKGADIAVEAVRLLGERGVSAHLDLVGDVFPGYEWFARELSELAARPGPVTSVTQHGFQRDVWPFLERSDVVLVPSRADEPFGNTAVEAVLAARPVVVSDSSGLREAAGGYSSARLVPPGDAAALADGVEEVVRSWGAIRQDAQDGARVARERHGAQRYRGLLVGIAGELLERT